MSRTCLWCHESIRGRVTEFVRRPGVVSWRGPTGVVHDQVGTERATWPACQKCAPLVMVGDCDRLAARALAQARRCADVLASMRREDLANAYRQVLDLLEEPDTERVPS